MLKRIVGTSEAAMYVGLAASTLERKRLTGGGPAFVRLGGRRIGYELAELDRWVERQKRQSSPKADPRR